MSNEEPNNSHSDQPGDNKPVHSDSSEEEYRLIPVRDLEIEEDHREIIDIIGLLKDLWEQKRTILLALLAVSLIGLVYYSTSERYYWSQASLMPEDQTSRSGLGQIFDQYRNILGVGGGGIQQGEGISVMLYPYIVESLSFQIELMQQEVYFSDIDQTLSIFEYFDEHKPKPPSELLFDYTLGLPFTIADWIRGESERSPIDFSLYADFEDPKRVDYRIQNVIRELERRIHIEREPQTDFILVGVSMSTPESSANMVQLVKRQLQRYVIEYKTEKAQQDLAFIQVQYETAKARYRATQDSLAAFRDRNINLSRASVQAQEERLQSDFTLAFDLYTTLSRRLEEAKIKVQEETPAFRVHEPATIPGSYAMPRANRIIAGAIFLGLFIGIGLVYGRRIGRNVVHEFRQREAKAYFS
ncbi:MAG: hypothetical protein JJU46_07785 [Balneolaceae bacterium]|nr:hypothetical protein [Balneolaceae bacterium]MCH8549884.1 hypothetical protein [Balneolaceae bacterium]